MLRMAKATLLVCFVLTVGFLATERSTGARNVSADSRTSRPHQPPTDQQEETTKAARPPDKCAPCPDAKESGLPLPSSYKTPAGQADFRKQLWDFLDSGKYVALGWCKDKWIRDAGPFANNIYLGTHPAVRVYYSPSMMRWLINGRVGPVPDGAMIIKEQYDLIPGDPDSGPPALRYQEMKQEDVTQKWNKYKDWTIMIKDSAGSKDGWFWSELYYAKPITEKGEKPALPPESYRPPFGVLSGGFGQYCARCHSSAESEFTFASLANVEGFPGMPLTFYVDHSWRTQEEGSVAKRQASINHRKAVSPDEGTAEAKERAGISWQPIPPSTMPNFKKFFGRDAGVPAGRIQAIPGENYDHVFAGPKGSEGFLTSNQCWWCHTGNTALGTMFTTANQKPPGANISPYGEWRWSPMGLAGRDPIFYSQLESEINYINTTKDTAKRERLQTQVTNLCFRCHGVMGKRQFDSDHGYDPRTPDNARKEPNFQLGFVYNAKMDSNLDGKEFKYGALARDGVSCMACHRIVEDKEPGNSGKPSLDYFLKHNITGRFKVGKPDEIFGPFKDDEIITRPMDQTLGIKPKFDSYIKSPRLCGSCHTIDLPIIDKPGFWKAIETDPNNEHYFNIEQATYLEWLNSEFQSELPSDGKKPGGKTCQDCHMPTTYSVTALDGEAKIPYQTQIATIEDNTYPASEHRAPFQDINVRYRKDGFARHQLQGLNLFMLALFTNSNLTVNYGSDSSPIWANPILGLRMSDWMISPFSDVPAAVDNFVQQAKYETADIDVTILPSNKNQELVADVKVTNKTGHRLPSGVGFRRAFIEFKVIQKDSAEGKEYILWGSGLTNNIGAIVDMNSCRKALGKEKLTEEDIEQCAETLASERIGLDSPGGKIKAFQPHFYAPYKSGPNASVDTDCLSGPASNPITREDQVQIYEELVKDATGNFTTSFIRRDEDFKDTRLLPRGWKKNGVDSQLKGRYLQATHPHLVDRNGRHLCTDTDRYYADGSGSSVVRYIVKLPSHIHPETVEIRATLQYQAIPPYYLGQRFEGVLPGGPSTATERLCFLTAYADLTKSAANLSQDPSKKQSTPIKNWRFPVASSKSRYKK